MARSQAQARTQAPARLRERARPGLGERIADATGALWGRRLVVILVALVLLAAGGIAGVTALAGGGDGKHITAYFDRAVAVHEGSDLKVLGVRVGSVDEIRPQGRQVRVRLTIDEGVEVPAHVRAVVVAPSVVSGRFVQLSPAYSGGPQIRDGAVISAEHTATPVEVDELLKSVTELSDALGPDGANKDGALAGLVETGAKNLDGNGKYIGDTIHQLGGASAVLNGNSGDLVKTVEQLQEFISMLKRKDGQVARAEQQLSEVAGFLAADKDDLAGALKELGTALGQVKGFISDNRGRLKSNVDKLASLTRSVVEQRASVAEALDVLPLAAANLDQAYNPRTRTIDGRANINELAGATGNPSGAAEDLVAVPEKRVKNLPALPLPPVGTVYGTADNAGGGRP
ncbi:ABC transporter substrate-binding protein [Streptomyces longisporoflavus]|uniref:MCE family protein n=1 Tax=Streptomyces longisporoflavus TaxID=28044 RepID=UPI00167EA9F9|nr:MCE family protein [Streptomyces longisporoflavus]GGV24605.1 ABC transporter substrate-binding protein [Streptomyces longisporoflavus]